MQKRILYLYNCICLCIGYTKCVKSIYLCFDKLITQKDNINLLLYTEPTTQTTLFISKIYYARIVSLLISSNHIKFVINYMYTSILNRIYYNLISRMLNIITIS